MTTLPLILPRERAVQALLCAFDGALVTLTQPAAHLALCGAAALAQSLRAAGLRLPADCETLWLQALDLAAAKAAQAQQEQPADDTLAFLLQAHGVVGADPALLRRAVDAYFEPFSAASALQPGAAAALSALRAGGYRLGIVANHACDRALQRAVRQLGLADIVHLALSSHAVGVRKPRPGLIETALSAWQVEPYQAVIISDRLEDDIAPAQELGLRAILLTAAPHGLKQAPVVPDAVLSAWHDLPPLFAQWQAEGDSDEGDFWAGEWPGEPPPLPPDFDPSAPA